jgi:YD repeat-containing protein
MKFKNIKETKTVVFILAVGLAFCTITVIFAADQFTYDSLGRLKTVTHDDGTTVEYAYDKTGNRVTAGEKVTSSNHVPNIPSSPDPYSGATGVVTLAVLQWAGGDSDGSSDTVTYSIYLDTNSNPTTLIGTVTQPGNVSPVTFALTESLSASTTYYWKVVPKDSKGATPDPGDIAIWNFSTTGC